MAEIKIEIERNPSAARLRDLGVLEWPVWNKEESTFPWTYDGAETCYFLEGDVIITPQGGEPVQVGKGDLVTFPDGMTCTWEVRKPVRKHFTFDL